MYIKINYSINEYADPAFRRWASVFNEKGILIAGAGGATWSEARTNAIEAACAMVQQMQDVPEPEETEL